MEHQWKMCPLRSLSNKWAASSWWHWVTQWKPVWGKCHERISWGYTRRACECEWVEPRCVLRLPPSAANLEGESGVEIGDWETDFRCFPSSWSSFPSRHEVPRDVAATSHTTGWWRKERETLTSAGVGRCVFMSWEEKNRWRSRCHLGLVDRGTVVWELCLPLTSGLSMGRSFQHSELYFAHL